jgi:DNA-directed RNA polymerase specialized sigma subunit
LNAEKFLNQLYKLNNLIKSDEEEIEQLRSLATSISGNMTQERVQSSTSNDKITDIVSKIIDLEKEIQDEIKRLIDLRKEVRDVINQVEDVNERLFLRYRYILFYQWKEISDKLDCSQTQVQRIKEKAIESVEQILKNVNKC